MRASAMTFIYNTTFLGNTSGAAGMIGHGGAVYAVETDLTIENSHFEDNECLESDCDGGAVYLAKTLFTSPTLTLTNTDFINNTAQQNGGGVWTSAEVVLNDGSFEGNQAAGSGSSSPKPW